MVVMKAFKVSRVWTITVVLALGLAARASAQGELRVGTWKLNLAKSTFNQGPAPKSVTIKIEAAGAGYKTIVDTVESDGRVRHFEATANADGKDYPRITTDGGLLPNGDVVALTRLDANTTRTIQKKDGKVIITRTSVMSSDGKTMTTTTTDTNALGQTSVNSVGVFDKQ